MFIEVTQERLTQFLAICKRHGIEYTDEEARKRCADFLDCLSDLEDFAQKKALKKKFKVCENNNTLGNTNINTLE